MSSAAAARRAAAARDSRRCAGEGAVIVATLAVEADDVVGGHVKRGALLAVVALELAGLEATLDEDAVALAELLGGTLGTIAEDADAVPVGALVHPAALAVGLAVADRDAELGDRTAGRGVAHLQDRDRGCR